MCSVRCTVYSVHEQITANLTDLLFRTFVLIEHLENRVKPVVAVDKYPICPQTVPLRWISTQIHEHNVHIHKKSV